MMKKTLLFGLLIASVGANAQQKLIATNITEYDQTGAIQYIDSNEYTYASWDGSLFSNEPTFKFEGAVYDWVYELPAIKWDVQNNYTGSSMPLTLNETFNNTIVNGNATVSQSGNQRIEFMYDLSGNLINRKDYFYNGTSYELGYENTFAFDGNNNLILEEGISYGGGTPELESVDSLFYNASNQMIRYANYSLDFTTSTLMISSESIITYAGTDILNVKLYQESSPGVFEWAFDIDYTYGAVNPLSLAGYQVTNGVPDSSPMIEIDFAYGANGRLSQYDAYLGGDLFQQNVYTYDAQDFITEIEESSLDFMTSALYTAQVQKFYYQSTAGIDEVAIAEARIYPNPSNDFISISTDSEIEEVAIFSSNGAIMLTQKSGDISIANLPAGVYIAKVKTSTGVAQARFVKQ